MQYVLDPRSRIRELLRTVVPFERYRLAAHVYPIAVSGVLMKSMALVCAMSVTCPRRTVTALPAADRAVSGPAVKRSNARCRKRAFVV